MADNKEAGDKKGSSGKNKMLPMIIGAVVVIAMAAGVVVMTAPSGNGGSDAKPDLHALEPHMWEEEISVTFNPMANRTGHCVVSYRFEYKALASHPVSNGESFDDRLLNKAKAQLLILLKDKSPADLKGSEGAIQLKNEIRDIYSEALFEKDEGLVSDVFITQLLFK